MCATNSPCGDGETPAAAAARLTGRAVAGERRLSAGLTEVTLDDRRVVMVKRGDGDGAARAEAAELRRLAGAGAVRLPSVYGDDPHRLVVDRVAQGPPSGTARRDEGRSAARAHAAATRRRLARLAAGAVRAALHPARRR
ncbi:hypothetical protein [Streptomyces poriticola]|uniref:hypothetical protein n=1 Tax=Streptomyces poriticola TaxID=3120506 RepID=UPI002FCE16A4